MSPDQMTNDPVIDGLLSRLDPAMIGSRNVRALHLTEARDHLLESKELHCSKGVDSQAAATAAVSEFGEVEEHAQPQRNLVWTRFGQSAAATGPLFAAVMFVFSHFFVDPAGSDLATGLLIAALQGLFFGLAMGWWPPPQTSTRSEPSCRNLGERKRWIPRWNYWSRVHVIEFTTSSGKTRSENIYPDTNNSDRLVMLAREKLQSRVNNGSGLRPATAR